MRTAALASAARAVTGANAQLTSLPLSASGTLLAEGAEAATAEAVASAASIASGIGDVKMLYDFGTFALGFIRGCR